MKIIVADDDKVVSMLVCGILREQGHQVLAAYDQMQTLMFALRPPEPDAIILDLNMPGGSGGETLRRLKTSARTSHIPVIVLSGTPDLEAPKQVLELGGAAFLSKPVDRERLLSELRGIAMVPQSLKPRSAPKVSRLTYG